MNILHVTAEHIVTVLYMFNNIGLPGERGFDGADGSPGPAGDPGDLIAGDQGPPGEQG